MFARLLILFITVPVIELCIFMMLGQKIGLFPTLAIIIITGFLGAYLTKSQGLKALRSYQEAISSGKLPHEAVLDGLMILIAGAVLLTPGFLTDAIGFSLLVPSIRKTVRGYLAESIKGKIHVAGQAMGRAPGPRRPDPEVITVDAEVVDTPRPQDDRT